MEATATESGMGSTQAALPSTEEPWRSIDIHGGTRLFNACMLRVEESIPTARGIFFADDFRKEASEIYVDQPGSPELVDGARRLAEIAARGIALNQAMAVLHQDPAGSSAPSTQTLRGSGRTRADPSFGGRASSRTPSTASTLSSTSAHTAKRQRAEESPLKPASAGNDDSITRQGEALASTLRSRIAGSAAFTTNTSIEAECFTPLLVECNLVRRKVCAEIERLGALLVEMPADRAS
mmetsp:Transcript_55714/g.116546  ORF Transcript_55714/g.116546 Transcript_55714/m.116546 type:complete len:238 (-) Transcript_55714:326-1039(-)